MQFQMSAANGGRLVITAASNPNVRLSNSHQHQAAHAWKKRNINSAPSPEKGQNEKLGGKFRCNILQRSSPLAMPLAMSSPAMQVGTMP